MKNYNRAVTCQNPTSGLKSHISQLKYRFQMLQTVLFEMKEIFVVFTPPPMFSWRMAKQSFLLINSK